MPRPVRLLVALTLVAVSGCKRAAPPPAAETKLVVFAAASLREAFTTMQTDFLWAHPGVDVTFNFAGSQHLRTQLGQGAPADVFASADRTNMDALIQASGAGPPVVFGRNVPVVVVAKTAAAKVRTFADLPAADRIVIGVPEVPIGRYTLQILDRASKTLGPDFRKRVEAKVVSRELDVKHVLAKVTLGEADAAVVYATDARATRDGVAVVPIPADVNVVAEYPISVVASAAHPQLARAWIEFVLGKGQQALLDAGFQAPPKAASAP